MWLARGLAPPLIALTLVACGSSGELSKADLIAQADKICAQHDNKVGPLSEPQSNKDFGLVEKNADVTAEADDDAAAKLKGLVAPGSVKTDYETYVKLAFVDHAATVRKIAAAARAKSERRVFALLSESLDRNFKATGVADKIGFKVCSH